MQTICHIIKDRIITVSDDASAHLLELLDIIDNLAAEERRVIFKRRLIDHDSGR